ncbi:MAG: Maf family protein [Gemmatimonadota bacterium]
MTKPRLVLASASPRRAELLRRLGLDAEVMPARVDERFLPGEEPKGHVARLARAKAEEVRSALPSGPDLLVVGGDTVVVLDDQVLGKPRDEDQAVEMLTRLAGRTHRVVSGVAVAAEWRTYTDVSVTEVTFCPFGPEEARAYVATGEPMDKAGAYGIQGCGAALVEQIQGDYYTVVGFPVSRLLALLSRAGWRYTFAGLEWNGGES